MFGFPQGQPLDRTRRRQADSLLFRNLLIKRNEINGAGQILRNSTWRGKRILRLATWNVRSINGKEYELIGEMKRAKVDLLGVTEIKKRGKGEMRIQDHVLLYSGTTDNRSVRAGVGFIFRESWASKIREWKAVNDRLMVVEMEEGEQLHSVIIAYGPNDNAIAAEKDLFFEELQREIDEAKGEPMIMGDLNGRVGKDREQWHGILGGYGEETKNDNGERILNICAENGLVITNSKFPHKEAHKYTREQPNRGEKSIIDYILIKQERIKEVIDVRVKRGFEIGSDHYLLKMDKVWRGDEQRRKYKAHSTKETIKSYRLKEEETATYYQEEIERRVRDPDYQWDSDEVETSWNHFKRMLLEAAALVCGKSKTGLRRQRTAWWNDEVKQAIKEKKSLWKRYLGNKTQENYGNYKRKRLEVKQKVMNSKKKTWEDFGNKMETDYKENQKLFYKVIKGLRKEKAPVLKHIKDTQGNILRNSEQIMERWREYFKELLEEGGDQGNRIENELIEDRSWEEDDYIEEDELQDALASMKLGKSPGIDEISPEMLKYMGPKGQEVMLHLLNLVWKKKIIPEEWKTAVIVPIFKKGDNRNCSNHRGISLLSVPSKIYSKILEKRIRSRVEHKLEEEQYGFRPNRSTQDLIFTMRQIQEKVIEKNRELSVCYVDLSKAFDRVQKGDILKALLEKGIDLGHVLAVESLYKKNRNIVRFANNTSKEFETTVGIRQGCSLSPLLFILALDSAIKNSKERMRKFHLGHFAMRQVKLSLLAFADDIVVFANNDRDLQYNIRVLQEELKVLNMDINTAKSKVMRIGRKPNRAMRIIRVNGDSLEQVDCFKYLGAHLQENGYMDTEITERIRAAGRMFYAVNRGFLNRREVKKKTKVAVFKTTFLPILAYSSESWTLTSKHRSRLQASEMRFLRKIMGKTRRDRVRNTTVRANLDVIPVTETIEQSRLRWFGHLLRMDPSRTARSAYNARVEGSRGRGRPRLKWEDGVKEACLKRRVDWNRRNELIRDRDNWVKLYKGTPHTA